MPWEYFIVFSSLDWSINVWQWWLFVNDFHVHLFIAFEAGYRYGAQANFKYTMCPCLALNTFKGVWIPNWSPFLVYTAPFSVGMIMCATQQWSHYQLFMTNLSSLLFRYTNSAPANVLMTPHTLMNSQIGTAWDQIQPAGEASGDTDFIHTPERISFLSTGGKNHVLSGQSLPFLLHAALGWTDTSRHLCPFLGEFGLKPSQYFSLSHSILKSLLNKHA